MIARLAAASAALALLQQGGAPFRAETRLVVVEATVRNTRGELVTGLTRDAFTILENGKRQPIVLFDKDDVPVSLGLLIDNSGSMRTKRAKVEAAAIDFARASNPLDEMFVLNFADKSRVDVPFTSDVHVLEAGLARVDSIGGTAMRDTIARCWSSSPTGTITRVSLPSRMFGRSRISTTSRCMRRDCSPARIHTRGASAASSWT